MIDHTYLADQQNELHAKALPVLRFGWSWTTVPIGCGSERLQPSGD